jgi:hypothetical protein
MNPAHPDPGTASRMRTAAGRACLILGVQPRTSQPAGSLGLARQDTQPARH